MTLERLYSLYELIGRMNSVYELQDLLEFVVDRALSLTGGRRGLLLLDDDREHTLLRPVAVARGEQLAEEDLERALEFVSTTVIKDVLDRGEPRIVMDLSVDQRYEGLTSDETSRFKRVRSVLAVPLKIEEERVGLIYIDHPKRHVFSQGDLDFLSAFAAQAAQAIHRTRQYQRQIEELTLLNKLSRSVVKVLDLDQVLARIIDEAIRMLNVETGSVLLLGDNGQTLSFSISISDGKRVEIPLSLKLGEGLAGWVVETGQVACVSDVAQDERWFGEVEAGFNTHSILCVPLKLDGRVLGVLQVLNKKSPHGFEESDVTLLSAFAASATIAIENARLFQDASRARQLHALNEVALKLSSTLDLETILHTSLEQSLEILRVDAGAISLIDSQAEDGELTVRVSWDLRANAVLDGPHLKALKFLSKLVVNSHTDETFFIDRDHLETIADCASLAAAGIQTVILTPIKVGREMMGVLILLELSSQVFSSEVISLLTGMARIIGLAVQNATHYTLMRSKTMQLTYLNEVGAVLTSSLDLKYILKVIIEGVNTLLETERTSVFLIDDETGELVLRYSNHYDAEIHLPAPWQGIAGWVATHDRPAVVNNTYSDPRHLREIAIETGYAADSILCVPLKIEDQVIGVVEALNKRGDRLFSYEHQALLVELARWAAIAIQNAHLYEARLREQERRIAAETQGAMAAVTLNMAHTMNNIVGAIRAWSASLVDAVQTAPTAPLERYEAKLCQIRGNAEEAITLIRNIRDPLQPVEPGPTDVQACLTEAIERCWRPDNVSLDQGHPQDLPLVWANDKGLEAVFHNLISNAIQALTTAGGGAIQITTGLIDGDRVEIAISDNGPGIPPQLQSRIFQPGVSGREDKLGIGLWLVETFIRRFEGQIKFSSSPETGTTFRVSLRAVQPEN